MFHKDTAMARECLYRFFSLMLAEPQRLTDPAIANDDNRWLVLAGAEWLDRDSDQLIGPSLERVFGHLQISGRLQDEYQRVFGLIPPRECPPFETEYLKQGETFFSSQQMADISGFYRAFGLAPGPMSTVRPDHLTLELEFMAFLLMKQRQLDRAENDPSAADWLAVCSQAEADFFRDHLEWWVPAFVTGLVKRASDGVYADLGRALGAFVAQECRHFGLKQTRRELSVIAHEPTEDAMECAGCIGN